MPITPDPPFPKSRNDTVRSKDWNEVVDEVIRLDTAKVDRAGDTITGPLTVAGALKVAGALTADIGLQVGTLTAVAEGGTGAGAWANIGSNAYFNGAWNRVDTTKAGANLHINGDGAGAEFRFMRVEADGSNQRNIAQIGSGGTYINEGTLFLTTPTANQWKVQVSSAVTGNDSGYGQYVGITADQGSATAYESTVNAAGAGMSMGVQSLAQAGGTGSAFGLYSLAYGAGTGPKYGLFSYVTGNGQKWAGYFTGDVHIQGALSKSTGSFLIDHVLDPENKTLRHSFVESPEQLCVYRGLVTLDENGRGTVALPDYFAALTDQGNATVQLTAVGEQPSAVSYRWDDEHTVVTVHGQAGADVSWLVLA